MVRTNLNVKGSAGGRSAMGGGMGGREVEGRPPRERTEAGISCFGNLLRCCPVKTQKILLVGKRTKILEMSYE
jgi:hypothetical protein